MIPPYLPDQRVPFPVEPDYAVRADLRKLPDSEAHFLLDREWPRYLRRKLELLESEADTCRIVSAEAGELASSYWEIAKLLALEYPVLFEVEGERFTSRPLGLAVGAGGEVSSTGPRGVDSGAGSLAGPGRPAGGGLRQRALDYLLGQAPRQRLLDALALSVQEDLVLMQTPPEEGRAALLHVCFPSHWNPAQKGGASFAELHQPVPHNGALLAGSRNLVRAMTTRGPFVRHVWSLTASRQLDQNPERPARGRSEGHALAGDSLYFRVERQTTRALGRHALFTIRIFVTPLKGVLDRERARTMARAIRSMDGELLRYKGLERVRPRLLEELDRLAQGG